VAQTKKVRIGADNVVFDDRPGRTYYAGSVYELPTEDAQKIVEAGRGEALEDLSVEELKAIAEREGAQLGGARKKAEIVEALSKKGDK
jgi:hypothetical protein